MMTRLFTALLLLVLSVSVFAQVTSVPQLMHFQGKLTRPDGTPVADGTYSVRFSLHDAVTGGNEKWNQTQSITSRNDIFAVLLSNFPTGTFHGDLWLEIQIGKDNPLIPRQPLASVAYAMKANSVPDGSITSSSIADGTITSEDLAVNALNSLSWLLGGNGITDPATQFLGTNNNQPLVFRTSNIERMRLLADGRIGIGTTSPGRLLQVGDPATTSVGLIRVGQNGSFTSRSWDFGIGSASLFGHRDNFGFKDNSGNTILTLQSSGQGGNVGINTNTPGARLHVIGNLRVDEGEYQSWGPLVLHPDVDNTGDDIVQFLNSAGSETMRVHSNGNVGIGTSSPTEKLHVNGNIRVADDAKILGLDQVVGYNDLKLYGDATGGPDIYIASGGNVGVHGNHHTNVSMTAWAQGQDYAFAAEGNSYMNGNLRVTGNLNVDSDLHVNGSGWADFWNLNSDARFKTHIQTLPDALDTILHLRGVSFEWKDPQRGAGRQVGFIAQEVEKVLPEIVHTRPDGYKGVGYQNVVPVLVEAMKQQQAQIEAQQRQMEAKEKRLLALEADHALVKAEDAALRRQLEEVSEVVRQVKAAQEQVRVHSVR